MLEKTWFSESVGKIVSKNVGAATKANCLEKIKIPVVEAQNRSACSSWVKEVKVIEVLKVSQITNKTGFQKFLTGKRNRSKK